MKSEHIVVCVAISILGMLEGIALLKEINGVIFTTMIGAICGITALCFGYELGIAKKKQ